MDIYVKNIEVIKEKNQEFAETIEKIEISEDIKVFLSRSNLPTIEVSKNGKKILLHSSYDPQKEAKEFIGAQNIPLECAIIIVLGIGLFYHIDEILKKISNNTYIWIIENDPKILKSCLMTRDISSVLQNEKIKIFCGDLSPGIFTTLFYDAFYPKIPDEKRIIIISHHPSVGLYPEWYQQLTKKIRDEAIQFAVLTQTIIFVSYKWAENLLRNITVVLKSQPVKILRDKLKEIPAIVVSAGPSLDKNIHYLKDAQGKAVIISVGTSFKPLLSKNIIPDFVVGIDADELHYKHFEGISEFSPILVCDPMIYPKILEEYRGTKIVGTTSQNPIKIWLSNHIGDPGMLPSGFSVATTALSFAHLLGCNPIALIGQDLAFSEAGKTHASGTTWEENKVDRDSPAFIRVPGNLGDEVLTDATFLSTLRWLERWIASSDRTTVNATEGGAKIEGTKIMKLQEFISEYCEKEIDIPYFVRSATHPRNLTKKRYNNIINDLSKVRNTLKNIEKLSEKGAKLSWELLEKVTSEEKNNEEIDKLSRELQVLIGKVRNNEKVSDFLDPFMQEIYVFLHKSEQENFKDFKDTPKLQREANRAGILFEGVILTAHKLLPLLDETIEKLK